MFKKIFSFFRFPSRPAFFFWGLVFFYCLTFSVLLEYFYNNQITGFFHIGKRQLINRRYFYQFNYLASSTWGYDGQYYLAVAHDPFFKIGLFRYLDGPAYRYSKIFFPFLSYLVAFGQKKLIPADMICLNFAIFFISCFALLKLIEKYHAPPILLFFYGLMPCFTIGLFWTTVDAFAASLTVIALYFLDNNKNILACFFMVLAALTKETTLILPVAAMIYFLMKKDLKKVSQFWWPLIIYFLWGLVIFNKTGRWAFLGNPESLALPFCTFFKEISFSLKQPFSLQNSLFLLWLLNCLLAVVLAVKSIITKRTILSISYFFTGILVLTVSHTIWMSYLGFSRITSLVAIWGIFYSLTEKEKIHLIPAAIFSVTSLLFLILLFSTRYI